MELSVGGLFVITVILVPSMFGQWWWKDVKNPSAGNGITVGRPKVFDRRSLELMLQQLDASLTRTVLLDQARVAAGVGLLQGISQRETSRALSASALPLPSVEVSEKRDATAGKLVEESRTTQTGAVTPAAPTLGPDGLPAVAEARYGIAAQDILSEQVNLTYQIFNLRMLLERSVTDRLRKDGTGKATPRVQAVLGFQVSLDPMRQHLGHTAVVEIEIETPGTGKKPPTLVALMPQEKTYNTAALSRKSHAFGVAAVAQVVTIGYSERRSGQTYYLYRDTDTAAFERPQPDGNKLLFGWQFRPVLNREAVEPGVRQMLAVVALDEEQAWSAENNEYPLKIIAHTYWVKYDHRRGVTTSGPKEQADAYTEQSFRVPAAQTLQDALGPRVQKVELRPHIDGNVLLDISGDNFYPGTTALLGGQLLPFDGSSGAQVLKSDQQLQIVTKAALLTKGQAYLNGRYGLSAPLEDKATLSVSARMPDPLRQVAAVRPATTPFRNNEVQVTLEGPYATQPPDLKGKHVIVTIGEQSFVVGPDEWGKVPQNKAATVNACLRTYLPVPPETLQGDSVVTATIPFLGPEYSATTLLRVPVAAQRTVLLLDGDPVQWGIVGYGFEDSMYRNTKVYADRVYDSQSGLDRSGETLLTLNTPRTELAKVKQVVVTIDSQPPVVLPAPTVAPPPEKMKVDATAVAVAVGSAPSITFSGARLDTITAVRFAGSSLEFKPDPDGKSIRVFLTRAVTEKPGRVALALETKDGSKEPAEFDVKP